MHKHGKRDSNHADVVKWFRQLGFGILDLADHGEGCFDLIATYGGKEYPVEVKDENGHFTPDQIKFFNEWTGTPITIITYQSDVIKMFNRIRGIK